MPFWKRWNRRRPAPAPDGPPSPPVVAGFASPGSTGRTILGKQVVRIGDPELWRQEDSLRERAASALGAEDEAQAQRLVALLGRYAGAGGPDAADALAMAGEVRAVGESLCASGGSDRMKLVAFRVAVLGAGNPYATVRTMESFWDGVCGWRV